jgi:hypothetical protein
MQNVDENWVNTFFGKYFEIAEMHMFCLNCWSAILVGATSLHIQYT